MHPLFNSILVNTGYKSSDGRAIEYTDYTKKAPAALVRDYVEKYNINTDCHNACINCQITQLEKYPDEEVWSIKTPKATIYNDPELVESVVALRRGQHVKVIHKLNNNIWKVSASRYTASCFEKPDEHKKFASMDKAVFAQRKCNECKADFVIESNTVIGYIDRLQLTAFLVECGFIPKEYIPSNVLKTFEDEDQQTLALASVDPSTWAKKMVSRVLRPQQEIALRCSAKHQVLRWGRRTGKSYSQAINILNFIQTHTFSEGKDVDGNDIKRGAVVLVLAPFLSQISLIWDNIEELIARNPILQEMTVRNVKTPFHQLEFNNGAVIKGFTTGAQSKSEGSTVRGQSSDLIYADEVDYMNSADLKKAIEPIMLTYPHVRLIVSSTPRGTREWFYKNARENPYFKEFYFPSSILDNWDNIKKTLDLTHDAFLQEYMADFIAQATGVYQPHFVSNAEVQFRYGQPEPVEFSGMWADVSKPQPGWTYSVGVDWNTNAGTEIAVVGLSPEGIAWVVECLNVPKQNWQMIKAERAIFDMNAKWKPRFIYVDAGYGVGQIEHMQATSLATGVTDPSHPDANLGSKLTAYDFGKKITFRDPNTGILKDTMAKPFLVENSIRHFENGAIVINGNDLTLHNQLLNYIVDHVSVNGVPTYGMVDKATGDHRLDAVNLALIAFKLEMTDFAVHSRAVTDIALAKGFGQDIVTNTIIRGDEKLIELANRIPLDENGQPVMGLHVFKMTYDPEYIKMKEAERIIKSKDGISRTEGLNSNPRDKKVKDFNPAVLTDTEWKCKVGSCGHPGCKNAQLKVFNRNGGKPGRRSF